MPFSQIIPSSPSPSESKSPLYTAAVCKTGKKTQLCIMAYLSKIHQKKESHIQALINFTGILHSS